MPTKNCIVSILLLLFAYPVLAQNTKGMYVNDFKNIIGDSEKENELLTYAQQEGFNYLLLYNLYAIHHQQFDLTDKVAAKPLADFIEKAKTQYGIIDVGAVGEKRSSFDKIVNFNNNYRNNPNQQFDIFNIEFEFWNNNLVASYYCENYLEPAGLTCNNTGAYKFFIEELKQIHELCGTLGLRSETYIGLIKPNQGHNIGKNCDRVLVHYYRGSDVYSNGNSLYNYKTNRLAQLAPHNGTLDVLPIFAATSEFMGPWLSNNTTDTAFDTFMDGQAGYNEDSGNWKNHIAIDGFQWYAYTHLLNYTNTSDPELNALQTNENDVGETTLMRNDYNYITFENVAVSLYPNPVGELLKIYCPANATVELINTRGDVLCQLGPKDPKIMNVSKFPNGVYFICVQVELELIVRKIMINGENNH